MDIFLLLTLLVGVLIIFFLELFLFLFLFHFFWLDFKIFISCVASLGIKVIFPLIISSLSIIEYTIGWSQCLESISLKL